MSLRFHGRPDFTYRGSPSTPAAGRAAPARRPSVSSNVVNLFGGISEGSAARTIAQIKAVRGDIELIVDSGGGGVIEAMEIAAALVDHPGKSTAIVCKAESAAVIPMAACDSVVMARDGSVHVHAVTFHAPGGVTLDNIGEAGDALRATQRNIGDVLAAHSRSTPSSFWTMLMAAHNGAGTRLSPEDCVAYGIADKVSVWPASYLRAGKR